MENLLLKLQAQARSHPSNPVLRRILPQFRVLLNGTRTDSPEVKTTFENIQRDLDVLATQGYWEPSKEDEDALRLLKRQLGLSRERVPDEHDADQHVESVQPSTSTPNHSHHSTPSNAYVSRSVPTSPKRAEQVRNPDISILQPPPLSTPLLPVSTLTPTVLPVELVQALNQVFFLHILATDPDRVLPPGKSLLSVISAPQANSQQRHDELPKLEERVKDVIHKEFWKEALEALSSPSPAVQLPRLGLLYRDLFTVLQPLLPQTHPLLITLSLPLSPTSSPLRSALVHLREMLGALRERCAPARDERIDRLIRDLDEPNQLATTEQLAELAINTTREILELADVMKEDMSQFVIGSMEEKDVKVVVTSQAMLREKSLILQMWPPSRLEPAWTRWLDELDTTTYPSLNSGDPHHRRWLLRLVQALGANSPVTCPLPTVNIPGSGSLPCAEHEHDPDHGVERPPNTLPPPFFVTCPGLRQIQNYLQGLVITAVLRSLVRFPPHRIPSTSSTTDHPCSFTHRIWTLLKAAVDGEAGAEATNIDNLADEVIQVRRDCTDPAQPCTAEEENTLRAAVDRTLQPRDPVFVLLQKRLLQGLAVWLTSGPDSGTASPSSHTPADGAAMPTTVHMHTGRERPGKRQRFQFSVEDPKSVFVGWERPRGKVQAIKGFEDEVLVKEVQGVFEEIAKSVDWTNRVWQDIVETGEIGGLSPPSQPASRSTSVERRH
ncbi:uncharacterized protein BXZ73DRAFT_42923 [Epithele typhae]|uniref:uncharacterized protein n=1 Tax=Epithele typhae TaxID=378194 RepID=UPI002007FAED|nr:uncharacterized protein BXZ73DRAFT_42923 [Epithele typhae]KAH9940447.1 hypothetical protein BXZ73DRAFT_42923 [Epithele typhae]